MINITKLERKHLAGCLDLIKELALFENAPQEVQLSLDQFEIDFDKQLFDAFVAIDDQKVVGMALYYYNYSTWKGKSLYLEDIVINEAYRRKGIGTRLFNEVKKVAKSQNVGRFAWQVLEWNESAIEFYKKHHAILDGEWINVKLTKEQLQSPE